MSRHFFTSESVTEGHPDKICDQISDAILDALLANDPSSRVACETTCTTGIVSVMGEITTNTYVDIPGIVRETVREIGYGNNGRIRNPPLRWETVEIGRGGVSPLASCKCPVIGRIWNPPLRILRQNPVVLHSAILNPI